VVAVPRAFWRDRVERDRRLTHEELRTACTGVARSGRERYVLVDYVGGAVAVVAAEPERTVSGVRDIANDAWGWRQAWKTLVGRSGTGCGGALANTCPCSGFVRVPIDSPGCGSGAVSAHDQIAVKDPRRSGWWRSDPDAGCFEPFRRMRSRSRR